eukprot:12020094-Ditylum_brightwellii.AAC.1
MPATEKAYGFMLNKAALEASDTSFKIKIQAFGNLTSATPLVSVIQEMLVNHATKFITKVEQFQVRTYHSLNGRLIPVYLTNGTIVPVEGQLVANRRPAGIIYIKIALDIKFCDIDLTNQGIYPFTFFAHLPMDTQGVLDNADSVLNSEASLKRPFNLLLSAIKENVQDANVDYTGYHKKLLELCLPAGWENITSKVYDKLCSHFTNDPVTIIQSIHQEYYSPEDSTHMVIQTVDEYFKAMQQMTNFLPKKGKWPFDVTLHFNTHLMDDVKQQTTVSNC